MQLGDLLRKEPGVPCVTREVRFYLLHQVQGVEHKTEAVALLVPVPDTLASQARLLAREFLERRDNEPDSPYRWKDEKTPGAPIPEDVLDSEENLIFLRLCLRDKDKPTQPFCGERDYALLRKGLVPRQVAYLLREYSNFLDEEYPETLQPAQRKDLEDQAAGES